MTHVLAEMGTNWHVLYLPEYAVAMPRVGNAPSV